MALNCRGGVHAEDLCGRVFSFSGGPRSLIQLGRNLVGVGGGGEVEREVGRKAAGLIVKRSQIPQFLDMLRALGFIGSAHREPVKSFKGRRGWGNSIILKDDSYSRVEDE